MDWSEILTESEAKYMQQTALPRLASVQWAAPLLASIKSSGGLTYGNKPLLFEARVASDLVFCGISPVKYEFRAGVGDTTVDFRVGSNPEWLAEVVSIGRSEAVEAATHRCGQFYGMSLTSPRADQSAQEQKQSEEREGLLAVQKIGAKVHDGTVPVKFPPPINGRYHMVIVDMRGHLGGGDVFDWTQIAFSSHSVRDEYRKFWIDKDGKKVPFLGVWHPDNPMRFAPTARERLHAIMFVAEDKYEDGGVRAQSWTACNPNLFKDKAEAEAALKNFPLWCQPKTT
jgi:hypothetical protein